MQEEPLVSVIIVNYNGLRFLDACLDSVRRSLNCRYEILVVDNASTDESVNHLRRCHPDVQVVASEVNGGFAAGNNLGARRARGRFLLLLNNDTIIDAPLDPMVQMVQDDERVGALGCGLMYAGGARQESIGLEHTALRLLLSWTPFERRLPRLFAHRALPASSPDYLRDRAEVSWVSGACMITPASVWKLLHGLDERYFMYVEDADYCRRVRMAGLQVVYTDRARVTHFEGAGRPWRGRRAILDSARSYLVYAEKFYGPLGRWAIRYLLPLIFLVRSLAYRTSFAFGFDAFGSEKAEAFRAAAMILVRHQPNRPAMTS